MEKKHIQCKLGKLVQVFKQRPIARLLCRMFFASGIQCKAVFMSSQGENV